MFMELSTFKSKEINVVGKISGLSFVSIMKKKMMENERFYIRILIIIIIYTIWLGFLLVFMFLLS